MKQTYFRYFWFVVILGALAGAVIFARWQAPGQIKTNLYHQWANTFIKTSGDVAYVKTDTAKDKDIVLSEGQSYGMLIAAEAGQKGLASQDDFDQLYRYYLAHRYNGTQLMSWRQTVTAEKVVDDDNNATDGDLYIAYALIQASHVWKDKATSYQKQAKAILADILAYNYNKTTGVLTLGNWADEASKNHYLMRTSDVVPAQFQAFYDLTGDKTWLDVNDKMLTALEKMSNQTKTGLVPDFMWVNADGSVSAAKAGTISSSYDDDYYYNACRVPYNLAQSQDKRAQAVTNRILDFFMTQEAIYGGYSLKGKVVDYHQSASFIAPVVLAASKNSAYTKLVQQHKYIFQQNLPSNNYYDSALTTLSALEAL